eukprot:Selendium_serpulae@DN5882_c0_g1_i5.p1
MGKLRSSPADEVASSQPSLDQPVSAILDAPSFRLSETSKHSARTITTCDGDTTDSDSTVSNSANWVCPNESEVPVAQIEVMGIPTAATPTPTLDGVNTSLPIRSTLSNPELMAITPTPFLRRSGSGALPERTIPLQNDVSRPDGEHETKGEAADLKPLSSLQLFSANATPVTSPTVYRLDNCKDRSSTDAGFLTQAPASPVPPLGATSYVVPGPRGASDIVVEGEEELEAQQKEFGADRIGDLQRACSEEFPWWRFLFCWSPNPEDVRPQFEVMNHGED